MGYTKRFWQMLFCSLALGACGPAAYAQYDGFFPAPSPSEETTLVVHNEYFGDMDVYAVTGSTRSRIGSVGIGKTQELRLPRIIAERPWIQLQLDPVGPVEPFTYQPITVMTGSRIELAIAPALQMSSVAIVIER